MTGDFFTNKKENPFLNTDEENFFMQPENIPLHENVTEPVRRLNDYDYNILQKEAYKDVSDELFKLEYKLAKTEEEIRALEAQIQAAKDIHDFTAVESLFNRKKQLIEEHQELTEIYNDTSLSAKISGGIFNAFSNKMKTKYSGVKKSLDMLGQLCLSKLPKRFSQVLEIKKSLSKLENINKSVDELMTLQTPYGEGGDKYIQLSKYITKANYIQSEISRFLK